METSYFCIIFDDCNVRTNRRHNYKFKGAQMAKQFIADLFPTSITRKNKVRGTMKIFKSQ